MNPNATGQPFGKAKDRFRVARHLSTNPGPGVYSPKNNFKEEEFMKKNPRAAIGRNTQSVLDAQYNMRELSLYPGPGAYTRFSDFGQKFN